jgi:hypothetical protein
MTRNKMLLGALVASAIGAIPLQSAAAVSLSIDVAPPPPRYEAVPAPRAGFVWAPGYWDYGSNKRYGWKTGHWERQRAGMAYHADRWEQRDGHWYHQHGGWGGMASNDHDHR